MHTMIGIRPGGRFIATNITLKMLIAVAYQLQDFQISGGPPWFNSDRYDIAAKAEGQPEGDLRAMTEEQREAEMDRRKLMLQAL